MGRTECCCELVVAHAFQRAADIRYSAVMKKAKHMTLAQLLFSQGFGTRKQCTQLIEQGAVTIDGDVHDDADEILEPHIIAAPDFRFHVAGADARNDINATDDDPPLLWPYREHAYVMLHKPAGFECSQKAKSHPSVYRLLAMPLRMRSAGGLDGVQAVGRLDQDTTGLLLFSDDGKFIHRMASPKHHVPKIYDVTLSEPATDAQIEKLLAGVVLDDDPAPVAALACTRMQRMHHAGAHDGTHKPAHKIQMTLAQGKYHQVKRMMAAVGNHVEALHRSQIGGLRLPDDLREGEWRWMTDSELVLAQRAQSDDGSVNANSK
jgi:16S rRNA pseudouridine516 synthase